VACGEALEGNFVIPVVLALAEKQPRWTDLGITASKEWLCRASGPLLSAAVCESLTMRYLFLVSFFTRIEEW